jgi:hypothetical protein
VRDVLLFHPVAPPFVQQTARALDEAGRLDALVTTFVYRPEGWLARTARGYRGGRALDRQLRRRELAALSSGRVITHPLPEVFRMGARVARLGPIASDLVWELTERWFDSLVARRHLDGARAVYGYEHAALGTFRAQRARGGRCLYEMPICHHRTMAELLDPEFARFPEARTRYDAHLRRMAARRNARKEAELGLADLVVTNSTFSRESILRAGVPPGRVVTVPLGAPPVLAGWERRGPGPFVSGRGPTTSWRPGGVWRRPGPSSCGSSAPCSCQRASWPGSRERSGSGRPSLGTSCSICIVARMSSSSPRSVRGSAW